MIFQQPGFPLAMPYRKHRQSRRKSSGREDDGPLPEMPLNGLVVCHEKLPGLTCL